MKKILAAVMIFFAAAAAAVWIGTASRTSRTERTVTLTLKSTVPPSTLAETALSEDPGKTQTRPPDASPAGKPIEDYEYAYAGYRPAYANVDIPDRRLLLVNGNFILPDDYEVKLAPAIAGEPDGAKLEYEAAAHYNEMYLAARRDGISLDPVSGYRSITRQRNNFNRKINKYLDEGYGKIEATQMAAKIILPPGTSEHNAGLAMDICSLYESFENSEEYKWLDERAAEYGFILRYPRDKREITGVTYEPWHWRYVGKENAEKIKASGLCLEEYLGAVR